MYILSYFRKHWRGPVLFLLCAAICGAVFYLYGLPAESVLYAAALCLVPCLGFLIVDIVSYSRRVRALGELLRNIRVSIERLPEPRDGVEGAYDALLRELSAVDGIRWLRLLYCYPGRITDGLVEEIASNPKVVKYIDMPIQHISDRVLRAMNRRDTAADIRSAVERLRSAVPDIVLRTTVITGFPGETEDEFEELRAFLRETRFERLGVFAYSREEGTPAYDLPDQIPEKLKRKRYDALMREQRKIHTAYNRAQVGKTLAVVCEGYDTVSESYYGRSYADAPDIDGRVFFSAPRRVREGELVRVEVSEVLDYDLVGKFIGEGEPQ